MRLTSQITFLTAAFLTAALTACNGGSFASGSKKSAKKDSADATEGAHDDQVDQANAKTLYVPVGGQKDLPPGVTNLGKSSPCVSDDAGVATCNGKTVTGNKLGDTTVHTAGGDVHIVVYDPKNPPPGVGASGDASGKIDSLGSSAGGPAAQFDDCLSKKADSYNLMLVFDNSGSQTDSDPNFVRRDGALQFVDQFQGYVSRNKKAQIYFGVLSFNTASIRSDQGWVRLNGTNSSLADSVKVMITKATSSPQGGTAYSPVLKDAAQYFSQINALPGAERVRNYVVFLTDGLPNAAEVAGGPFGGGGGGSPDQLVESLADIPRAVNDLVSKYGVAMIAIASGPDIPFNGESMVQSLAKPVTGIKFPDHVGRYYRARTPDDLKVVWSSLLSQIGSCN